MDAVGVNDVSRNTAIGQSDKEDKIRAHNLHLVCVFIGHAKGILTGAPRIPIPADAPIALQLGQ